RVKPTEPRLNVMPLVREIVDAVIAMLRDHPALKWHATGEVSVRVGIMLAQGSLGKRTVEQRRKRVRRALDAAMNEAGWRSLAAGTHAHYKKLGIDESQI